MNTQSEPIVYPFAFCLGCFITRRLREEVRGRLVSYFHTNNPSVLCEEDVRTAYNYYSEVFFQGGLPKDIEFAVSSKMTAKAGMFTCVYKSNSLSDMKLSISGKLILSLFTNQGERVTMGGINAYDRVTALQLVLEHEIVHILVSSSKQCIECVEKKKEYKPHGLFFKQVVNGIFGHTSSSHSLFNVRSFTIGQNVTFTDNEKVKLSGKIEKINQFTVLVNCGDSRYRVRHDVID